MSLHHFLDMPLTKGLSSSCQFLAGLRRNGCSFLGALRQSVRTRALSIISFLVNSPPPVNRGKPFENYMSARPILGQDDKINEKNIILVGFLAYGNVCLLLAMLQRRSI